MRPTVTSPASSFAVRIRRTAGASRPLRILMALIAFIILSLPALARPTSVTIYLGRPSRDCTGFGICGIVIDRSSDPHAAAARAVLEGNQLTIAFEQSSTNREETLVIDEPLTIDSQAAHELGVSGLKILPGAYPVDYETNPHGTVTLAVQRIGITVNIEVGRRSKGCTGFGICSITVGADLTDRSVPAAVTANGNELTLELLAEPTEHGDVMMIDEDIVLDQRASIALGSRHITIPHGSYPVDYSTNPHGTVTLGMNRIGITIDVRIGRKSRDCHGFGICSITIGTDLDGSSTSAIGTLRGNQLEVDLLSQPNEQGNAMTIDEPIVLDEQVARALGSNALMILPGTYPVDFSNNPNGTVVVDVRRTGITINVEIGRPSMHCVRGLGICSITIGTSIAQHGVPAIASIDHNKLGLLFTSELPEQGNVMTIEDDIALDSSVARMLGSRGVMIQKGDYTIQRRADGLQYAELDVKQNAIGVTIYIGRSSSNCRGFGICRIVIDRELSMQAVRAIATVKNGGLELEWLDKAQEQGSALMIDEALKLDPATAAALGLEGSEIVPGGYPVDYTTNPDGTVLLGLRVTETSGVDADASSMSTSGSLALPNPATGATTIQFLVHRGGPVTVLLSDARGRHIATLADAVYMEPGNRTVSFDAASLPQGTYFYSIRSAKAVEAGRVVVTH